MSCARRAMSRAATCSPIGGRPIRSCPLCRRRRPRWRAPTSMRWSPWARSRPCRPACGEPDHSDRVRGQQLRSDRARLCAEPGQARRQRHRRVPAPDRAVREAGRAATQAFPERKRLAVLWDYISADMFEAAERQARLLGLEVISRRLENPPYDIDAAFRGIAESGANMLLVLSSAFFAATATGSSSWRSASGCPRCSSSRATPRPAG